MHTYTHTQMMTEIHCLGVFWIEFYVLFDLLFEKQKFSNINCRVQISAYYKLV